MTNFKFKRMNKYIANTLDFAKFFVVSVPIACVIYTCAMLISFCKKTIEIFGK